MTSLSDELDTVLESYGMDRCERVREAALKVAHLRD